MLLIGNQYSVNKIVFVVPENIVYGMIVALYHRYVHQDHCKDRPQNPQAL